MSENLRKVIQKQELFSKKDCLLVGVSGGIDSMVLCHLLFQEGFSFKIAHCNYHFREQESDLDEQLVRSWAAEHKVPFFTKSCPYIEKRNVQEEARKIRYAFFKEVKIQECCKYILTAHHSDDQIETFFINLSRGSGINGLSGIKHKKSDLIRPLLSVSKSEIYNYAIKYKVPYREDQTNQQVDYLRNYFRNEVIPLIKTRIPAFNEMTLRSMDHLSEIATFADQEFQDWKSTNIEENSTELKIAKPKIERFYLISSLLVELGFHPETIYQVKMNYLKAGKIFTDKNKHELLVDRHFIYIRLMYSDEIISNYSINDDQGELNLSQANLSWKTEAKTNDSILFGVTKNEVVLDKNRLKFPLILRKWLSGDIIKPLGMNGKTKKIQDVLTNSKISIFDKQKTYVLVSGEDILWVPGIIRSEIAKIDTDTELYFDMKWKLLPKSI